MAEQLKPEKLENEVEDSITTEKPETIRLACKMKEISEPLDNKYSNCPKSLWKFQVQN